MPVKIRLKHSSTVNKAPLPTDLVEGELALNINAANPAAYIKDSAGVVRKIAGITVGGTAPATPTTGMAWLDTTVPTKPVFKVYDGTAWQGAGSGTSAGAAAPAAPAAGDLWVDTTVPTAPVLKVYNGTAFVAVTPDASTTAKGVVQLADAAAITAGTAGRIVDAAQLKAAQAAQAGSATAPAAPTTGQVWINNSVTPAVTNVWNGTAWIPQVGATISSATAPTAPVTGQVWIDTSVTPNVTKIWDGTAWVTATPDGAAAAAVANDAKYATKAELATENTWDRTGTALAPANAGDVVTISAGTAALPGLTPVGDPNTGLWAPAADTLALSVKGGEALRIDDQKRVGIGTTSVSASLGFGASIDTTPSNVSKIHLYNDGGGTVYGFGVSTNQLNYRTGLSSDAHVWYAASSERFRCDSSGRLLVGTSSSSATNTVLVQGHSSGSTGQGIIQMAVGSATPSDGSQLGKLQFSDNTHTASCNIAAMRDGGTWSGSSKPTRLEFSTTADGAASPTERMRIGQSGQIGTYTTGNYAFGVNTSASAGTSSSIYFGNRNSSDANGSGGTTVFYVWSNGNVQNTNGSYTAISDAKLKENIVDAASQWSDFKAIQIRNWNFKTETGHETHRQIGPIAQELEAVCPGLVFETPDRDKDGNDTGEVTKGVNQSVLYMKAVKALQEAMERIETLEAKVTALETA